MHDAELQRLLDEAAIRTVLTKYVRAVDRMDWELLRSCYHPDAIDDHGAYNGPIEGFVEWLQATRPHQRASMHLLGTPLIEIEGDTGWSETYCLAIVCFPAADGLPARDQVSPVRYCDRFERRHSEWRIAHRIVAYEPARIDPVAWEREFTDLHVRGVRDRSDAAYRRS